MKKFKGLYESLLNQNPAYRVTKFDLDRGAFGVSPEASSILMRIESMTGMEPSQSIPSARSLITEIMNLKDPTEKKWLVWHLNATLPSAPLRMNYVRNYVESINEGETLDSIKSWVDSLNIGPKYEKFEQVLELVDSILDMVRSIKMLVRNTRHLSDNYKAVIGIEAEANAMKEEMNRHMAGRRRGGRPHRPPSTSDFNGVPIPESVDYKKVFSVVRTVFSLILLVMQLVKIVKSASELRRIFGHRVDNMNGYARILHKELAAENDQSIDFTDYTVNPA